MKQNEPSRTALMIARQRAVHQLLDHGSILNDPFALKILCEDEKDVLQFASAHPLASVGRLFTAARSRIAEDALSAAVKRGVQQIVILGSGLDTFALRNPHGAREIRIYEVDHPATQTWKRERLSEAQLTLPSGLHFVPVDFEWDDARDKLAAAGFDQNSRAFFTGLGVVPYLTQAAIVCTLGYIASVPNSEVVFDYMEAPEAFSDELRKIEEARAEQLKKIGERSLSRFEQMTLQRFYARADSTISKKSISRRSGPGSAMLFKDLRGEKWVFILSTLSTSQAVKRHGSAVICDSERRLRNQSFDITKPQRTFLSSRRAEITKSLIEPGFVI